MEITEACSNDQQTSRRINAGCSIAVEQKQGIFVFCKKKELTITDKGNQDNRIIEVSMIYIEEVANEQRIFFQKKKTVP